MRVCVIHGEWVNSVLGSDSRDEQKFCRKGQMCGIKYCMFVAK